MNESKTLKVKVELPSYEMRKGDNYTKNVIKRYVANAIADRLEELPIDVVMEENFINDGTVFYVTVNLVSNRKMKLIKAEGDVLYWDKAREKEG